MAERRLLDDENSAEPIRRGDWVDVGNEFAYIRVCKVWTRNGERLEILAPKLGRSIRLDPIELEVLTLQTTETFADLRAQSLGSG